MGEHLLGGFRVAPSLIVTLHRLGIRRFFVVIRIARRHRIDRLRYLPTLASFDDRILDNVTRFQFDRLAVLVITFLGASRRSGQYLKHGQLVSARRSKL